MEGIFKAQKIEFGKVVQEVELPNKITMGARILIADLLATKVAGYTPPVTFGLDRFILFDIDYSTAPCMEQMLLGGFDYYDEFDPIYLTDITVSSFPCLGNDPLIVTDLSDDITEEPLADESLIIGTLLDNMITFTIKIGKGFVGLTPRKFAMAGLFGKSSNSNNTEVFCYAIEQFPVMVKTVASTFKFEWICFV